MAVSVSCQAAREVARIRAGTDAGKTHHWAAIQVKAAVWPFSQRSVPLRGDGLLRRVDGPWRGRTITELAVTYLGGGAVK